MANPKPVKPAAVKSAKRSPKPSVPAKGAQPAAVKPPKLAQLPVAAKSRPPQVARKPAVVDPAELPPTLGKAVEPVVELAQTVASTLTTAAAATDIEIDQSIATPVITPIQKGFSAMAENITAQSFVPTPEKMQAMFGDFSARTKTAVEKSTKLVEEMGEFAKGNVEALISSGRVAAKGAETLGQEAADYSKKSLESAASAFKTMAAAKSPTEFFKLQSDYARSSFDTAVAESSKFSEAMLKLLGEIAQPLSTRISIAAEKIKTPAF